MSRAEENEPNRETDPEALGRALEMELIMKRASWQEMRERRALGGCLILSFFCPPYFAKAMPRHEGEKPATEGVESRLGRARPQSDWQRFAECATSGA